MVSAFLNFSEFHLDLVSYTVIRLMQETDRLRYDQDSGILGSWITNLSRFLGRFCKAYHDKINLSGICQFVVESLEQGQVEMVVYLKDIV
jgi:hypothetical protein